MKIAYESVGRAVLACQQLEAALIPIFKVYSAYHRDDGTDVFISEKDYKKPPTNYLKELAESGTIAPELSERFVKFYDDRNHLVHRWTLKNGLPTDDRDWLALAQAAVAVEREARSLTLIVVGYVVKHGDPDQPNLDMDEYRQRMREIFTHAHLDQNKEE